MDKTTRRNIQFRNTPQHRRALEKIENRDKGRYQTMGDYIAAAVLAFGSHHRAAETVTREEVAQMIEDALQDLRTAGAPDPSQTELDVVKGILHGCIIDNLGPAVRLGESQIYRIGSREIIRSGSRTHEALNDAEVNWQSVTDDLGGYRTDTRGRYLFLRDGETGEAWTWREGEDRPRKA